MSATATTDISRWKRSRYRCPACDRPLWVLSLTDAVIYFCGVGKCPSLAANNGASSIEELRKNVENEPERKEDEDWP